MYKRQFPGGAKLFLLKQLKHLIFKVILEQNYFTFDDKFYLQKDDYEHVNAVSYTHLDVYKRQTLHRAVCRKLFYSV